MTVDLARAQADRAYLAQMLARLDPACIAELARRAQETSEPDGYPGSVLGPPGSSELTSVENAAGRHAPNDQVERWIHELFQILNHMADQASRIDARRQLVINIKPERENSVTQCVNCAQPALPRPRAGRCEPCYRYRLDHAGEDRPPAMWDTPKRRTG